jgi:hypothetical protein
MIPEEMGVCPEKRKKENRANLTKRLTRLSRFGRFITKN